MTIIIIVITVLTSLYGFKNEEFFNKFKFNAFMVVHRKEWYRIISYGFLHSRESIWHLIINMLVLYSFGTNVEAVFNMLGANGIIDYPMVWYVVLYLSALVISSTLDLVQHKNDSYYNAIGASGAVSAILFAAIFFSPMNMIYFYGFIPLPGILYGVLYLVYSWYMAKRGIDNIGHEAHLMGAIYGFIFPLFIDLKLIKIFIGSF